MCTLTMTRNRARYGERIPSMPSRFVYEMRGKEPPLEQIAAYHANCASFTAGSAKKPAKKKAKKKTRKRRTKK